MAHPITKAHLTACFSKQKIVAPQKQSKENLAQASVLVPIIEEDNKLLVLFTERTAHLKDHAGQISFPGGKMNVTDTSLEQTCLRETMEEIGLPPQQIEIIGSLEPSISSTGFLVTPYVGIVQPPLNLTIDPFEVANAFTAPLDYLVNPLNHQQEIFYHQGKARPIYVIEYEQFRIWGLTASIIVGLAKLLNQF